MASRQMEQGNYRGTPPQQPESTSVIDQYSNFDGTYNSARDLRVEGQVKGNIVCKGTLHVAQGATVNASVEAEAMSVAGEVEGEITCRGRLELLPSGRVKGEISTQSLVIHEGAVYEGDLEMGNEAGRSRRSRRASAERAESSESRSSSSGESRSAAAPESDESEATEATEPAPRQEAEAPAARPSSFIRRFGSSEQQAPPAAPEATDE